MAGNPTARMPADGTGTKKANSLRRIASRSEWISVPPSAHRRVAGLVAFDGDAYSLVAQIAEAERAVLWNRVDTPALGCHMRTLRFHDAAQIGSRLKRPVFDRSAVTVADDEPTGLVYRIERICCTAASGHARSMPQRGAATASSLVICCMCLRAAVPSSGAMGRTLHVPVGNGPALAETVRLQLARKL